MKGLERLKSVRFEIAPNDAPDDAGSAGIVVKFSDGTVLRASYWRLIHDGRAEFSSFDHQQKYGLPAPFDAKQQIVSRLSAGICHSVQFDSETGDLTLMFDGTAKLQVFNFTAYEIWELHFPDGAVEFSNRALGD
jgi:hypothetical protein